VNVESESPELVVAEVAYGVSPWAIARFCLAAGFAVFGVLELARYGELKAVEQSENLNVARALAAGEGFANPFDGKTGPTSWTPPVLPAILAGLYWYTDGSQRFVSTSIVVLQTIAIALTGVFVVALGQLTARRLGPEIAACVFLVVVAAQFRVCFQSASIDCWLVLTGVNALLAGLCWFRPLDSTMRASLWGIFGGGAALCNPVLGFAWAGTTTVLALRRRVWRRWAAAFFAAAVAMSPWMIRNYLTFGRLIPVKSNAIFELYQTQVTQKTGMLQTFHAHPYSASSPVGREYRQLGEMAFLDKKREQVLTAIRENPGDFLNRVADRFLGATLSYEPFQRGMELRYPRLSQSIFILPFVAATVLLCKGIVTNLSPERWAALGVYSLYLLPYIVISYYDRYAVALVGVKTVLIFWGMDEALSWCVGLVRMALPRGSPMIAETP
jgi:hypothetical protein